MIDIKEIKRWLGTLDSRNFLGVDDGGLTLVEIDEEGLATGARLQLGGIPEDQEE